MLGRKGRARIVALAVVVAMSLSGCSSEAARINRKLLDLELSELEVSLYEIPAVTLVRIDRGEIDEFGYSLSVRVTSNQLTMAETARIVDEVNEVLAQPALDSEVPYFDIEMASGEMTISQSVFGIPRQRLLDDIEYQFAIGEAVGAPFALQYYGETARADGDNYRRTFGASLNPDSRGWEALLAVPSADSAVYTDWNFPGLFTNGGLPSAELTSVISTLTAPSSVDDDTEVATWLTWTAQSQTLEVAIAEAFIDGGPVPTPPGVWRKVIEAAKVLANSNAGGLQLGFYSNETVTIPGSYAHFGPCADEEQATDADVRLFNSLVEAGIIFAYGSGPGSCSQRSI